MNGPAATLPPSAAADDADPTGARPIAVVWCRQVDNEEESPGYTTIPEEFPGQRETVDTVRAVGHLAINVADTHDYWDPDPGTSLSYYPNLFLYPAFRGEYTCVGRMFLSKEDRPRLGMKTLVLPTAELLQPEVYGPAVLRWHASMGGLRRTLGRDPPASDPVLYDRVGEGFLFHRGSTDPVLLVASERWEATMQVLLELLGSLPAALASLGGILAFPYFLPQARTDLKELQERIPLTLAVMRVPRTEAAGPRYDRRLQSWETTSMTVRDLASEDLGGTGAKGKEVLPLVLQYARDHQDDKLLALRQRVDLVELPRLRAHFSEAERQTGRARRKECWRIGTAMESAALLLQRTRGRQAPLSGETAKRAQEYLNVSPPGLPPESREPGRPGAARLGGALNSPSAWPAAPGALAEAAEDAEAVPIPTREDPSLLPPSARSPMLGLAVPGETPGSFDEPELKRLVREEVERQLLDTARNPNDGSAAPVNPSVAARVDALAASVTALPTQFESRLVASAQQHQLALAALREEILARTTAEEAKLRTSFAAALAPEIDRRVRQAVEPKLAETVHEEAERAQRVAMEQVEQAIAEMHQRLQNAEDETRSTLTSQLDRHLRDAADRELTVREAMEGRLKESLSNRSAEAEEHLAQAGALTEERLSGQLEAKHQEVREWVERLQADAEARGAGLLEQRLQTFEERSEARIQTQEAEIKESYTQAIADLQVRFEQHIEDRIREAEDAERDKYLQLFARLKEELDAAATKRLEAAGAGTALPKGLDAAIALRQKEALAALDQKLATTEERMQVVQSESVQRLERLEELLGEKSDALARLEQTLRNDLDDLDHRTQLLTDRLVPVVRKAWLKIAEMQQAAPSGPGSTARVDDSRKELLAETRRLEAEMEKRIGEIRQRVESAISHQGRIWLTLVHHLKELAEERTNALTGPSGGSAPIWQEPEAAAQRSAPPPVVSAPTARPSAGPSASEAPVDVPRTPPRRPFRRSAEPRE
ncbi:MAG TPA: hypothetical protein VGS23_05385 [Thermoplasmata archaeon]|nr:hypothetical protein [Thermoplasmata archaeon]